MTLLDPKLADQARLDQALADYVTADRATVAFHRDISVPGQHGQMAPLLREVSQTLLPRRLTFVTDHAAMLALEVIDRHIHAVVTMVPAPADRGDLVIIGRPLAEASDTAASQVHRLLAGFTARSTVLQVRVERIDRGQQGARTAGLSVTRLLRLGPTLTDAAAAGPGPIASFVARLGPMGQATLMTRAAAVVQRSGDPGLLARLDLLQADMTAAADPAPIQPDADQMIILSTGTLNDQGPAMLLAEVGGTRLLVAFDGARILDVAALWLTCRAGC